MLSRRQLIFGAFHQTQDAPSPAATASPLPAAGRQVVAIGEHCLAEQNVVCRSCGEICPHDAIRFSPRLGGASLPVVDPARCDACGDCLPICPNSALSLVSSSHSASLSRHPEELVA